MRRALIIGMSSVALSAFGCGGQDDEASNGRPASSEADVPRFCELARDISRVANRAFREAARTGEDSVKGLRATTRRVKRQTARRYQAAYQVAPVELQEALRKAQRANTPEEVSSTQRPIQAFLRDNC